MSEDLIRIEPQPRNGKPFRIAFQNRGLEWWYNERLGYPKTTNKMLVSWKCPFGANGEPVKIDGVWYWQLIRKPIPDNLWDQIVELRKEYAGILEGEKLE